MVLNTELCSLQVQEVKETLDGLWKGATSRNSKYGVEKSVHIRLEDTLFGGGRGGGEGRGGRRGRGEGKRKGKGRGEEGEEERGEGEEGVEGEGRREMGGGRGEGGGEGEEKKEGGRIESGKS